MRAVELAAKDAGDGEPWQVSKVYWTAVPKELMFERLQEFKDAPDNPFKDVKTVDDLPFGTKAEDIAAAIEGTAYLPAKVAAMRAHASQIAADDWLFKVAEMGGESVETFTLGYGERGETDARGWETDLFAGLEA